MNVSGTHSSLRSQLRDYSSNCTDERLKQIIKDALNSNDAGDATWILTSAFIIFTMQSGFGLLEAGSCSVKNECNIMIKNAIDVVFGAFSYWLCGFGFSFGQSKYTNGFTGVGNFLTESSNEDMGHVYAKYFFQLSFATTATTIVSGAMAERTNLKAYMLFSFLNVLSYVFPAHWIWDDSGFLKKMGAIDIAGCGPVHLIGGTSALVATIMLKPRSKYRRFSKKNKFDYFSASPTNVVLGTFMMWWGWLGFNCGSTFGVSGGKWQLASRTAVVTVNGSVGGGLFGIFYSYILTKKYERKLNVGIFTTGLLGGLVGITGICAICKPWEALVIGCIGGMISCYGVELMKFLHIDDPVSCVPVHGFAAIWGMISIGLFAEVDTLENLNSNYGLFKGGGISLLGYQCLSVVCFCGWAAVTTAIELFVADKVFGLRISTENELLGSDLIEHGIKPDEFTDYIQEDALNSTDNQFTQSQKVRRIRRKGSVVFGKKISLRRKDSLELNNPNYLNIPNGSNKEETKRTKTRLFGTRFRKVLRFKRRQSKDNQNNSDDNISMETPREILGNRYYNTGVVNFGVLTITDSDINQASVKDNTVSQTMEEIKRNAPYIVNQNRKHSMSHI